MSNASNIITLYTESNPNPNSLKFVANRMLVPEGLSRDYATVAEADEAPLAKALFKQFNFVERVFYMSNFVTVTKQEAIEWFEVKGEIQQFIKSFIESGKSILTEKFTEQKEDSAAGDDFESQIIGVLEEYIKPAVEMDGGAIAFNSFKDGIVTVSLQGACSGCPSSTITLKSGIENLLKKMIPEVTEVVALEE